MTTLGALLETAGLAADLSADAAATEVSTVELDSRRCTKGSIFVCMSGTAASGEAYVGDALERGAVCVVASAPVPVAPVVVHVASSELRSALAALSGAAVGNPAGELTLTGVTGTNGKTTVTWLIEGILAQVGYAAASIGTLTGQRTTPAAPDLHRELRVIADTASHAGLPGAAALEVSSHALDQGRVEGIRFDVAVFTNLSHEHLDYHGSMRDYFEAKASLFAPERAAAGVVCVDDEWGRELAARTEIPTVEVATSAASNVGIDIGSTSFRWRSRDVQTRLTGHVNVTNALLALLAVDALGVEQDQAVRALSSVAPVPGRLEAVGSWGPRVLVDYAHTPAALELVLADLRAISPASRLTVVFGCGGERDKAKRPAMGEVATRLADEVVVTSDNPRSEDPDRIIDAILEGATGSARIRREPDRAAAIAEAISDADDDDVVLIAGKGHETTQEIAGTFFELDDRVVAAAALRGRGSAC